MILHYALYTNNPLCWLHVLISIINQTDYVPCCKCLIDILQLFPLWCLLILQLLYQTPFNKWTHWLIFTTETTTCDDCLLVLVSLFTWVLMASKLPNTWLLPLPLTFWYLLQNHLFGTSPNLVLLLFVMVSNTINPFQYHTLSLCEPSWFSIVHYMYPTWNLFPCSCK